MSHSDSPYPYSSTERQILEAAKLVFARKGMDGARMQEIADEAGLNKALLHYYFRSKERLFEAVFKEVFHAFFPKIMVYMASEDLSFEDKIRRFVDEYIDLILAHPYLPGFITHSLSEGGESRERIVSMFGAGGIDRELFGKMVRKEIENGNIPEIDPLHLILDIVSMCIFPFIGAPVIEELLWKGKDYRQFLMERKKHVSDFVIKAIRYHE